MNEDRTAGGGTQEVGALKSERLTVRTRLLKSPVAMSWTFMSIRISSTWFVLGFAFRILSAPEVAVWLLLSLLAGFQSLVDFGFSNTFARAVTYARQGRSLETIRVQAIEDGEPLVELSRLWKCMTSIYWRLAAISLCAGLVFAPIFAARTMDSAQLGRGGWLLLVLVVCGASVSVWGSKYKAILIGFNQIAIMRRWDSIISVLTVGLSVGCLYVTRSVVALVIADLAGQLAIVARDMFLARRCFRPSSEAVASRGLRKVLWSTAWRSGLGISFGYAALQTGGLLAALVRNPLESASYLLALRLFQVASQISGVPFYSHLPVMAERFALGNASQMLGAAKRRFAAGSSLMAGGAAAIVLLGPKLLEVLGSGIRLPSGVVLSLLAVGYVADRVSSMNQQLHGVANVIHWHWINGVLFVSVLFLSILLAPSLGIAGLALALCIPIVLFELPVSAVITNRIFPTAGWRFQSRVSTVQLAVVVIALVISVARGS